MDRLGLCLPLEKFGLSQYSKYNFNSITKYKGMYLGANENGIFILDDAKKDNGVNIDAQIRTHTFDMNVAHQKRVRAAYVGGEADGMMKMELTDDEHKTTEYLFEMDNQKQRSQKIALNALENRGRYYYIDIKNVNGSDFSVDRIEVLPIILGRYVD